MYYYYLNLTPQSSGQYELHKSTCGWLSLATNKAYIGYFGSCVEAMAAAKRQYPLISSRIDGCAYCCTTCHTG